MEPMTGFLIRYHRLAQNISQEGLCKGICVVSYLSKIEQGQVHAGEDIVQQLFSALSITYHDDPSFLVHYQQVLTSFFTKFFLEEDVIEDIEELNKEKEALLNSPLCIDVQLAIGYYFSIHEEARALTQIAQLKPFLSMMKEDQLYLYYTLRSINHYGEQAILELEQAGRYHVSSVHHFRLGRSYCHAGRFGEAIEHLRKSYDFACDEGNAFMMLQNALFLGNCYCVTREAELMIKYYEKCELLARTMHREGMRAIIQYNIGASYLEWGEFELALSHLRQCLQVEVTKDVDLLLVYQKLALVYCELEDEEQMRIYIQKSDEEVQEDTWMVHQKMNAFLHLYCDTHTRYQDACQELLEELCFHTKDLSYGYRSFHANYLLQLYIHRRRYKDALQLTTTYRLQQFLEK